MALPLIAAVLCGSVAYVVTVMRGERYSADTTIVLSLDLVRPINPIPNQSSNPVQDERLLGNEREFVASREVFTAAAQAVGGAPATLERAVDISLGSTANTILVRATARTPSDARAYSEAVATAYVERRLEVRRQQIQAALDSVARTLVELSAATAAEGASEGSAAQQEYVRWFAIRQSLQVQSGIGQDFAEVVAPPSFEDNPVGLSPLATSVLAALLGAGVIWSLRLLRHQTQSGEPAPAERPTHESLPVPPPMPSGTASETDAPGAPVLQEPAHPGAPESARAESVEPPSHHLPGGAGPPSYAFGATDAAAPVAEEAHLAPGDQLSTSRDAR